MQKVQGVVATAKGAPVSVETIMIPDPGPGDVIVRVVSCGVCQTDEHYVAGGVGDNFPYLLGHESSAIVEEVGEGVTNVAPGDHVILNWRAVCGECRACAKGQPQYCFATHNASRKMTLEDGTELEAALGIGSFAEKTLVAAGQCTKIPEDLSRAQLHAVGLLGCGVSAGLGATLNTGEVRRGETVAVIGCGGVGCAAIAGAKLAGASRIIAVDIDARKLQWAQHFGAEVLVDATTTDAVSAIQEHTGGFGADVVIDAAGTAQTYSQAFAARDLAGRVVLVGVPAPGTTVEMDLATVFSHGGSVRPSWYGDTLPSRDFPAYVAQYLAGDLDLDAFVSERIRLDQVGAAFETMKQGKVLRSVVEIEGAAV
ncbi:MAG: S-(hydroxymethyl)mycothiol dehydrogenase [Corynebacterium sp.]|nr:S-(hydroxymethyl)mycothiol dehydrogenase [Corynebacterium sp.]